MDSVEHAHSKTKVSAMGLSKGSQGTRVSNWVCVTLVSKGCLCVCCLPSVWTQESTCHLVETNIKDQEELEGRKVPQYPCLWVNVSAVGRWAMLYHTEDTRDQNQQVTDGGWVY